MDLLGGIPSYCGSSDISSSAKIISSKKITSSGETNNYHKSVSVNSNLDVVGITESIESLGKPDAVMINPKDFSVVSTSQNSDGLVPGGKQTYSNKNLGPIPEVFNKLTDEQRENKIYQIYEQLKSSQKYSLEIKYCDVDYTRYVFKVKNYKNQHFDYPVVLFYDFKYSYGCYFDGKCFDKDLLNILAPLIHFNAELIFQNINELQEESIGVFEQIITNYSIDIYAEVDKIKYILLYPGKDGMGYVPKEEL